ncbi:MAG: response regulator [Bacteroidota bacterium]
MKKILLIEDNEDVRNNTAEILMLSKYEVFTASNGKEGLEMAQKNRPDLIICDIMMPLLDGHEVLHLLSKNDATAGIPFIFLSAKAERHDVRKGFEMGADDYLTKPFKGMELLNAIEARLKRTEVFQKEFTNNFQDVSTFINEARGLESLKKLSEDREIRMYRRKDEVYKAGAYPKGIFFINSGKIKICQKSDQGKELITSLHKEGEFFGYMSLIKDEPYLHSAVAMEDTEVYMIPKDDFFALLYKNTDVSRKFIELLSENVHQHEEQLIKLAYHSIRKRVAEALIRLFDKYEGSPESPLSMNISREDLANLVGTAHESVVRTLSDFKEEQYISISGKTITILEYDKLKSLKN